MDMRLYLPALGFAVILSLFGSIFVRPGLKRRGPHLNPIQIENQRHGTIAWLLTNVANNHEIEGYASLDSVDRGQPISIFVNTSDPRYTMTIYRMGYYGGLGARKMTRAIARKGIAQPIPSPDPVMGMVECQWTDPYTFEIPRNWVSGFYLVKLVGQPSGKERYVIFVVRNDSDPATLLFQSATTTYQSYNAWGGRSLYAFNSEGGIAAVKVSYNRPYDDSQGAGKFLTWELDAVGFLEQEGYDVSYAASTDTHESPLALLSHKALMSWGHDEYWSYEMRQNVTAARDAGVNLGIFSADVCSWQIRFEPSSITGAADRTQVAYKDNWKNDPLAMNPATYYLVTAGWATARYTYPAHPADALIGARYNGKSPLDGNILIGDTSNWVFDNTGLKSGDMLVGLLGREVSAEEGSQPADTILLAHSPYTFTDGTTHYGDMTLYQAATGAWVFSTGTMQWSWGLSSVSPWGPPSPRINPATQQMTRNVLGRFIGTSAAGAE